MTAGSGRDNLACKHTWKKTTTKYWRPTSRCDPGVLLILLFWALIQSLCMHVSQTFLKMLLSSFQEGSRACFFFPKQQKNLFFHSLSPSLGITRAAPHICWPKLAFIACRGESFATPTLLPQAPPPPRQLQKDRTKEMERSPKKLKVRRCTTNKQTSGSVGSGPLEGLGAAPNRGK